jgi:putative AlgH/UPF0301 family transcriptional regulator
MNLLSQQTRYLFLISIVKSIHSFVPISLHGENIAESCLHMAKPSHRAFFEKNLEDAMGNDWREFRALLVAKEASEIQSPTNTEKEKGNAARKNKDDKGDLGDMFADAISSIFHPKEKEGSISRNHVSSLDDDKIGHGISSDELYCEDPFLSQEEIPIENTVSIDKHRWAHAIPHVEPGCVLLSNELLGGVFRQTVVLVIDHTKEQGSTGVIINRPLKGDLQTVAMRQNTTLDISLKFAFSEAPVTYGGPVNSNQFSLLHDFGEVEGSRKVTSGVYVGGSEELIDEVRLNRINPKEVLFVKGHAAWVAGQLEKEISRNVWYPAAVSKELIFRYANGSPSENSDAPSDLWSEIMKCMGNEFATLAHATDGQGDYRMAP